MDTLGRWMAHHVADLIAEAERTNGEEKNVAEKKCFDAVLALWKHRAELPNGKRPFEDLEPVVRAIESLDPDDDTPRYFRSARPPKGEGEKKSEADTWLDMASGLDYSAKVLIGYCLGEAARSAVDKSKEWVKRAEAAGAEDGVPEIVIRFVSSSVDLGKKIDPNAEVRRQLQDRLRRLEGFTKLMEAFASDLRKRLETLPSPEEDDGEATDDHVFVSSAPLFPPSETA